ncbi:restriction endonuclease subunit S [Trichlorobacter lovleyi]|uniref:restriction endonuclease subunit S n=1 Tax=Trichlorobacter lovleyi TaxID=313985 RepID=UPI00248172B2|nr:restriction endonuclease subunit S [Trichlorobacter lovleyi]
MQLLEKHFDIAFTAPDGIKKLRELILSLAFQGKLVPQDPNDPPTNELLKNIEIEKSRLVKEGKIKVPKPFPPIKPEDVQYQLPKGWEWVSLGNVSEVNGGFAFKSSKYSNDGMRVVRISDFDEKGFKNDKVVRYPFSDDLKNFKLEPQNILMAMTGGTVGKSLLVKELPEPMVVNQRVATIRILPGVVPEYLNSLIQTNLIQNVIRNAKNSTNDNISMADITGFHVPLAPLAEQRRIVAKIDELMARCDELKKLRNQREQKRLDVHKAALNSLLSASETNSCASSWSFITRNFSELYSVKENVAELRKAILQLAVMGKLVPQDPNDQPATELLKEIEADKKRLVKEGKIKAAKPLPPIKPEEVPYQLPNGWEWVRLGELGISQTGTTPPSKDRENFGNFIPFVGPGDIKNGSIDYSGEGLSEQGVSKGRLIDANSVLMVCIGGSIGKHAINERDTTCNQQINTLTPYSPVLVKYIYSVMAAVYFQSAVISQAGGSATPIINKQKWSGIPVPISPLPEQHRIVARIDQLMALCDALEQQIYDATNKQAELLNALMARV